MIAINVYSPKGGVGTTTTAALLALDLSKHRYVGLVAKDSDAIHGTLGYDGTPSLPNKVTHGLTISDAPVADVDFNVIDSKDYMAAADINILVIQNSYLALRKAKDSKFDLVVLNLIEERPLGTNDVGTVLGCSDKMHVMSWSPTVARSLDAGLTGRVLEQTEFQGLVKRVKDLISEALAPF
jgi:MinD-like ATPase involved in chromosome partitioning or flagellar assembly